MTTKANSTVSLKTSQGDVRVKKGKLLFMQFIQEKPGIGLFCWNWKRDTYYQIGNTNHPENQYLNESIVIKPIIISETERIETGDWVLLLDSLGKPFLQPQQYKGQGVITKDHKKILVLPEQFSSKHIDAIVNKKLKDNTEVYVQCKRVGYQHMSADFVELDSNNYVTLHKVEQKTYTKEEVINILKDIFKNPSNEDLFEHYSGDYRNLNDYIKENL